jgi:hypothetical protein
MASSPTLDSDMPASGSEVCSRSNKQLSSASYTLSVVLFEQASRQGEKGARCSYCAESKQ